MRDLAKSMISFSWAMSLFGLEQLGNTMRELKEEESREDRMSGAFDSVTKATHRGFDERMQSLFEAGDQLQREMVDLFFDVVGSDSLKPDRVIDRAAEMAERSAERLREAAEGRRGDEEGEEVAADAAD